MTKRRWPWKKFLLQVVVLAIVPSLFAVGFNLARPTPLTWVAKEPYEIFQDCPEATETAEAISVEAIRKNPKAFLIIDARMPKAFKEGHIEGAINIPYDPLFPVSEANIQNVQAARKGRRVVVVGEGKTAKLLAEDLMTQGLERADHLPEDAEWRKLLGEKGE